MGTEAAKVIKMEAIAATPGTVALALGGITVGGRAGGLAAVVETAVDPGSSGGTALKGGKLIRLGVSKLDGEGEWIVDSLSVGGLPVYANGVGSRCTRLKAVSDAGIVAALDAAAAEAGLA